MCEVGEVDVFVGGVGLVDGAGADADGGDASGGEVGGVGEPGGSRESDGGVGVEEVLDDGVGGICLHGWIFVWGDDFEGEVEVGGGFLEELECAAGLGEGGGDADVELGFGEVRDDVGA